jgi:hypothetical protein
MKRLHRIMFLAAVAFFLSGSAFAEDAAFYTGRFVPRLRAMIGRPLLDESIAFNNATGFVLEELLPEGSRFFLGGNGKRPGENADDMRQNHGFIVLITPCSGSHDLNAKISTVAIWENLDSKEASDTGVGLEQLLALMNTPPGVVTPSTLRVPKVKNLHGPVFEYVRGDTTETLSLVNEGAALRLSWTSTNTGVCPH